MSLVACSNGKDKIEGKHFNGPKQASEGSFLIKTEKDLQKFVSFDCNQEIGYITSSITLSEKLLIERSGITIEANPSAVISIDFPEDEDFLWPVTNTMDAIVVNADNVKMNGIILSAANNDKNAYNAINLKKARNFVFKNGNITGELSVDSEKVVTDYSLATGIIVGTASDGTRIENAVIKDVLTPVQIASGSSCIKNLIFNSDILISYEYGSEPDVSITGCTSLPSKKTVDGGRITFKEGPYKTHLSQSLYDSYKAENTSIQFNFE